MDAYEEAIETPYLKQPPNSIPLSYVGVIQTIDFLPWCLKFILAFPSDSINLWGYGHRRPFVVIGLIVAGIAFASLATFSAAAAASVPYMTLMIIRNIGIGVADCAVDGLSVDAGIDSESGALQGWMSLGRTVGTVISCILAGNIAKTQGYQLGIVVSAAFVFVPVPMNWFIVEEWDDSAAYADKIQAAADKASRGKAGGAVPDAAAPLLAIAAAEEAGKRAAGEPAAAAAAAGGGVPTEEEAGAARKIARRPSFVQRVAAAAGFDWDLLCEVVGQRHVWMFLMYIFLTTLGVAIANFSLSSWLLDDLAFDEGEIGEAMAVMSVGCFLVSLPLGYVFDYIPFKRAMLIFAALACALANLALVFCNTKPLAYVGLLGFGAAHGAIFVVQNSMSRILAESRIAAVFFAIVNSMCNIAHAIGTLVTGYIVEARPAWRNEPTYFYVRRPFAKLEYECCVEPEPPAEKEVCRIVESAAACSAPGSLLKIVCEEICPPYSDYILSFFVATAIDIIATLFVLFIPGEKLKVDESGSLRVLPHRKNLAFADAATRATARNAVAEKLKAGAAPLPAWREKEELASVNGVAMSPRLADFLAKSSLTGAAGAGAVYSPSGRELPSTASAYSSVHARTLLSFGLEAGGAAAPAAAPGVLGAAWAAMAPEAQPRARTPGTPSAAAAAADKTRPSSVADGLGRAGGAVSTSELMARLAAVPRFDAISSPGYSPRGAAAFGSESPSVTVNPLARRFDGGDSPGAAMEWKPKH